MAIKPDGSTLYVVYAANSDADGWVVPVNTANNTATASTAVSSVADLSVTKTGPDVVTAGANATYTITVRNAGPSNAQSVTLTDSLGCHVTRCYDATSE